MALVPAGRCPIVRGDGTEELAEVPAFFLDRQAGDEPPVRAVRGRRLLRRPGALAARGLAEPPAVHRPDRPARPGRLGARQLPGGQGRPPGRRHLLVRGRRPTPAGSASGCRPPPSGRRPAAGPSTSAAAPARDTPGATCSTRTRANLWASGLGDDGPRRRLPRRRHPQRHPPDDRQRLGVARRPARRHPRPIAGDDVPPLEADAADRRRGLRHLPARRGHLPLRHRPGGAGPPRQHRLPLRPLGRARLRRRPPDPPAARRRVLDRPVRGSGAIGHEPRSRCTCTADESPRARALPALRGAMRGRRLRPVLRAVGGHPARSAAGRPPRIVGILGPSGVGKTVYLGMLLDLLARGVGGLHGMARGLVLAVAASPGDARPGAASGSPTRRPSSPTAGNGSTARSSSGRRGPPLRPGHPRRRRRGRGGRDRATPDPTRPSAP